MRKKEQKRAIFDEQKIIKYISMISLVVLYTIFVVFRFQPVFPRIDDVKMRWIISGAYTGDPSAYGLFLKYPFAYLMSILYRGFPEIPWYGGVFIAIHAICLFVITDKVLRIFPVKKFWKSILVCVIVILIYSFFNIENILLLEYTSLAALAGGTALFLLITQENKEKGKYRDYIFAILLLMLCYFLRLSVFKMILPFVLVILCTKMNYKKMDSTVGFLKNNLKIFVFVVVGVLCIGSMRMINESEYSTKEWKNFREYNSKRSALFDYDAIPDYWENLEFYTSLGITEEVYNSILDYNIGFSEKVSIDTINKIYEKSKDIKEHKSVKTGILTAYNALFHEEYAITTTILIVIALLNLVIMLFNRKKALFLGFLFCTGGVLLESIGVGIGGRFPDRVIMSLTLVWTCLNFSYLLLGWKEMKFCRHEKTQYLQERKSEFIFLSLAFIFIIGLGLTVKYDIISTKRYEAFKKLEDTQPIKEYMAFHKDNFYFMTTHLMSRYYIESWSETPTYCNFHELGGWEMYSPCYNEKMKKLGFESVEEALLQENVYIITDEWYAIEYMTFYFNEKFYNDKYYNGITANIEETLQADGREYYVVKFNKSI